MIFKNKITRTAAFIVSCILAAVFSFNIINVVNRSSKFYAEESYYENIYAIDHELNDIYSDLWLIGMMYLRNLDENGKFKGTPEAEKQTIEILKKHHCMDENGNLSIETENGYEYLVSYGDNKFSTFTNTEKNFSELSGESSFTRIDDNISNHAGYWNYSNYDFNWYETNYGMTYYYIHGNGEAVFDFDISDCRSYIDELGATIYYKLDGSTPIPYDYLDMSCSPFTREQYERPVVEEDYYDYTNEDEPQNITDFMDETGIYYFNNDTKTLTKVSERDFNEWQGDEYLLTIAVRPPDSVIAMQEEFLKSCEDFDKEVVHSIMDTLPVGIIAVVLALYVIIMGGYSVKEKKTVLGYTDKIFLEFPLLLMILMIIVVGVSLDSFRDINQFFDKYYKLEYIPYVGAVVCGIIFGFAIQLINTIVIRLKCRSFWKTTLIYRILRWIYLCIKKIAYCINKKRLTKEMLKNDKFTRRFIFRTVIIVLGEIITAIISFDWGFIGFFVFESIMLFILYTYLSIIDLNAMYRLNKHISDMNSGDYSKRTEKIDSPIYTSTEKLNNISFGIKQAVDEQVKSERMKIDLVTNVSHDLKTPLTSIISYIDLLSTEELNTTARDYVNIIGRKSERLKIMVADLFDLAKATSGTEVKKEDIDAVVLLRQVLGDLEDKIKNSGREVRTDIKAESAAIEADGQKMYRVLQNIIDNALKYSMEKTRIYISLRIIGAESEIEIKNIASYEMTFKPDEITERFTRGDESRSTEGNGLGLAIAKSYTEACGGELKVDIDGDMFIVKVTMPLRTVE